LSDVSSFDAPCGIEKLRDLKFLVGCVCAKGGDVFLLVKGAARAAGSGGSKVLVRVFWFVGKWASTDLSGTVYWAMFSVERGAAGRGLAVKDEGLRLGCTLGFI